MTTVETSPVAIPVDALARQQARVDRLLPRVAAGERWGARLAARDRERLVRHGHFPEYAAELAWTPREVAGHLRDSALVFTERIYRLRTESEPLLADFVPDEDERIAGYRGVPPVELVEQLRTAQAALFDSVARLTPTDLDRPGVHAVDGPVTLADLVEFLPGHQRDHADQLAALLGQG